MSLSGPDSVYHLQGHGFEPGWIPGMIYKKKRQEIPVSGFFAWHSHERLRHLSEPEVACVRNGECRKRDPGAGMCERRGMPELRILMHIWCLKKDGSSPAYGYIDNGKNRQ
jgi:hypothetical protein